MIKRLFQKVRSNIKIYKEDLKTKGLYYSIIHRLYKLPFFKSVFSPVINYFKPEFILLGNQKLYIDKQDLIVSEKLLYSKEWEEYETKMFIKSLKKGQVLLDIGAHIGYYTLLGSKFIGKKGKVYAFEPDPKNFQILQKNVKENNCSNVILINKAVCDRSGKIKLYLNKENTGDHRTYNSKDGRKSIDIDSISLDEYFSANQKVDVIKIDIQGGEFKALKGASQLLKRNNHIKIFTEFWPYGLSLGKSNPKDYLKLLTKNQFKAYQISENIKGLIPFNPKQFQSSIFDKENYINLLCIKN